MLGQFWGSRMEGSKSSSGWVEAYGVVLVDALPWDGWRKILDIAMMEMWDVKEGVFWRGGMGRDVPSLRTAATRVEAKKATVERNFILNGLKALIDSVEEVVAVARRSETRGRGEEAGCDADDGFNISSPHDATYTFSLYPTLRYPISLLLV